MASKMDEFREFVNKYPKIRDEVRQGKRTWQNIYEEWVLYGENDNQWQQYRSDTSQQKPNNSSNNTPLNVDSIKSIVGYVKSINPDSLNRTLNTIQRVIQIAQSVGGSKTSVSPPMYPGPYNDWWD